MAWLVSVLIFQVECLSPVSFSSCVNQEQTNGTPLFTPTKVLASYSAPNKQGLRQAHFSITGNVTNGDLIDLNKTTNEYSK